MKICTREGHVWRPEKQRVVAGGEHRFWEGQVYFKTEDFMAYLQDTGKGQMERGERQRSCTDWMFREKSFSKWEEHRAYVAVHMNLDSRRFFYHKEW